MKYVSGKYFSKEIAVKGRALEMQLMRDFLKNGPTTDAGTQREWQNRIEDATFGKNTVIYDDLGNPSVMVMFEAKSMDELGLSGTSMHPAFIVDGNFKAAIYISKYQNIIIGTAGSGRAVSLPMRDSQTYITYGTAKSACEAKGAGWHLMTNVEWAAIALWCKANGFQPRGNNNYGSDVSATYERGKETYLDSGAGKTGRVATGSGPASWAHDGTPAGIYDLNGNVWEWVQGLKIINGIAHVMIDNNFADPESAWVNTGVDITAGMSSGQRIATMRTGAVPNTPSMVWDALAIPATTSTGGSPDYGLDYYLFNKTDERLPVRGGSWNRGSGAGVFALHLIHARSDSGAYIGFRSAFIS